MYKACFCSFPKGRSKVKIRVVCCRYYHNSQRPLSHLIGKVGWSLCPKELVSAGERNALLGQRRVFVNVCVSVDLMLRV